MTNIRQIYEYLMRTMDNLLLLIIGIALLAFVWGVFRYLKSYDNEKERSASVKYITYGIMSLLVIVSLWGFVYILADTIGVRLGGVNTNIGGAGPSPSSLEFYNGDGGGNQDF